MSSVLLYMYTFFGLFHIAKKNWFKNFIIIIVLVNSLVKDYKSN